MITLINQFFEVQQKSSQEPDMAEKLERNFNRISTIFEEAGYTINNPLGEKYSDSRTDCTANIVGNESANMYISQVIKPVIYQELDGALTLVQKGIVIVESK